VTPWGRSSKKNAESSQEHQWLSDGELSDRFASLITEGDVIREAWKDLIVNFMSRLRAKRQEAADNSGRAHWLQRGSAGASAAVSAVTGGALLGTLSGSLAKIIGVIAATVGVASAGVVAAKPGNSFVTNLRKKAKYEQLYWELYTFGVTDLARIDEDAFRAKMTKFEERESVIMNDPSSRTDY
jgi:hypothetical protein